MHDQKNKVRRIDDEWVVLSEIRLVALFLIQQDLILDERRKVDVQKRKKKTMHELYPWICEASAEDWFDQKMSIEERSPRVGHDFDDLDYEQWCIEFLFHNQLSSHEWRTNHRLTIDNNHRPHLQECHSANRSKFGSFTYSMSHRDQCIANVCWSVVRLWSWHWRSVHLLHPWSILWFQHASREEAAGGGDGKWDAPTCQMKFIRATWFSLHRLGRSFPGGNFRQPSSKVNSKQLLDK